MSDVMKESFLEGIPVRRGKVRDVYDFGDRLLFVATDRISAFDWILPTAIPGKGRLLTRLSRFWFDWLQVDSHFISEDLSTLDLPSGADRNALAGRSMIVRKTDVIPVECVVRGYLAGSGWKEYSRQGTVCSHRLPPGLSESDRLPEPVFTPAIKAESGHDENISYEVMCGLHGRELSEELRRRSLEIYSRGAEYALSKGIIIADTKFEFGLLDGQILLIDEVMTPDSSRFWPADSYRPGGSPPSFDKQFVRDWLMTSGWDQNSPPPELPEHVVTGTVSKYEEACLLLTGRRASEVL